MGARWRLAFSLLLLGCGGATSKEPSGGDGGNGGDGGDGGRGGTPLTPTCVDAIQNGDETDVDCGGSCLPCPDYPICEDDDVCGPNLCIDGVCAPAPYGADCSPNCELFELCSKDSQCRDKVCDEGVCQPPPCADGAQNGLETDVDCGGPNCPACALAERCALDRDCLSGFCDAELCAET